MVSASDSVSWNVDRPSRTVTIRVEGDVSGSFFINRIQILFRELGKEEKFSYIYDSLRYYGSISNDHIRTLCEQCTEHTAAEGIHIVVNRDPGFPFWMSALRLQYPDWKIYLTESLDTARRLLAQLRSQEGAG